MNNKEKVYKAYEALAEETCLWKYRYNNPYLLSKVLVDYSLMSEIDIENKRVLNIGCFEPMDEVYYAARVKEWHAIDINSKGIAVAEELVGREMAEELRDRIHFKVEDATELSFPDNSFDIVVSFSTIDHIPSPDGRMKAISEMCRVLRKGGHVIITVPNRWNLFFRYYVHPNNTRKIGYEYAFSPLELRKLICQNNMKIIDKASSSFNPMSFVHLLLKRLRLDAVLKYAGMRFGYLAEKL